MDSPTADKYETEEFWHSRYPDVESVVKALKRAWEDCYDWDGTGRSFEMFAHDNETEMYRLFELFGLENESVL